MNLLADHFPFAAQLVIWFLFMLTMVAAIRHAPWYHLKDYASLNILLAMTVGVMVMWAMKAGFAPGLKIHLLGAALLTLMFGWAFAVLSIFTVVAGHALINGSGWSGLPMEVLLLGMLPAMLSYGLYRVVEARLPNHFFVYIFITAFFGAGLAVAAVVSATSLVHIISGNYSSGDIWNNYTRYALLLVFPEGFITGMLMTIFIVYRPQWVSSFDDNRYLKGK